MSGISSISVTDGTVGRNGGLVWNRLQSERQDLCEVLLNVKEFKPRSEAHPAEQSMSEEEAMRATNWHRELLHARLRKIDDALDRLMSGSYGNCCKCGRWIEDTKLDFDPAIAFCIECWQREQSQSRTGPLTTAQSQTHLQMVPRRHLLDHFVAINPSLAGLALETLTPFDTIWVRTLNSDYRILLLDPMTGRALVEGGPHLAEPVDATVSGSTFGGSTLKIGWIGVGLRIEMWVNGKRVSTSPVQSVRLEQQTSTRPASAAFVNSQM